MCSHELYNDGYLRKSEDHPSNPLLKVYLTSDLKHKREQRDENNLGSEWALLYSHISPKTSQQEGISV